jgi:hypothetical protein
VRTVAESTLPLPHAGELGRSRDTDFDRVNDLLTPEESSRIVNGAIGIPSPARVEYEAVGGGKTSEGAAPGHQGPYGLLLASRIALT